MNCTTVLCGLFGESGMEDVLKIKKGQWKSSKSYLFKTLFHWANAFCVPQFSTVSQFLYFCSSFSI